MNKKENRSFPVGYFEFHKKQVFNFQLNRWYSLGFGNFDEYKKIGEKIETFEDWKDEMIKNAKEAISENRFLDAAIYYRATL